jgi:hypothetical protein
MGFEEITPHLNKIATLYLKNNKRKVGWIFIDQESRKNQQPLEEVFFISVQKGKKHQRALEKMDHKELEPHCEKILIEMIERIRSSK